MAKIVVLLMHPPYGSLKAQEGLEFALASTNYGHECRVIFCGDGLYQLIGPQSPHKQKNHLKQLNLLPLYDIDTLYVCEASMAVLALSANDFNEKAKLVSPESIRQILTDSDFTVTF